MVAAGEPSVPGDVATASTATTTPQNEGGEAEAAAGGTYGSSNSGEDRVMDDGERGFGGNRWPRQETLALLKIRSDMDVAFRDATLKGPLWEDVSRKLGELGYNRSAKKCKEKFENVFKYHKRTKDGRSSKGVGKTYRFFDQLEAFEHHHPSLYHQSLSPRTLYQAPPVVTSVPAPATVSLPMPAAATIIYPPGTTASNVTTRILPPPPVPISIPSFPSSVTITTANPTDLRPPPQAAATSNPSNYPHHQSSNIPSSFHNIPTDLLSNSTTSSSTSSDMELEGMRRKKKRKWRDFFERLMKEVVDKQEELQKRFLEAMEKREQERLVREEAWRMQEMTRINREREILAQERSMSAAKNAAVMAFLQKVAEQQNPGSVAAAAQAILSNSIAPPPPVLPQPTPTPFPTPTSAAAPVQKSQPPQPQPVFNTELKGSSDNGERSNYGGGGASSSRWPKVEVEALINMRTNLDSKYEENGPKGPLWEEISAGMRKLGYNRNAKRCKEKWENINKYFKKVKESNKRRPEDSKTCPYFHQLDALYRQKHKHDTSSSSVPNQINSVPLMVRPEQQWPQPEHQQQQDDRETEDMMESDQNGEDDDRDTGDDEEEDEDDGGGFEIVQNNKQVNAVDANV